MRDEISLCLSEVSSSFVKDDPMMASAVDGFNYYYRWWRKRARWRFIIEALTGGYSLVGFGCYTAWPDV